MRTATPGKLKPGDGFTNRDEYRGFHYVTDDWDEASPDKTKIRWASTDPTKKDVFFWDTSSDGRYAQAVRSILEKKTGYVFRRVSEEQANARIKGGASGGVNKLNRNSPTKQTTYNFALVYRNAALANASDPNEGGNSGGNRSNGNAISIDEQTLAARCQTTGFPLNVLRAVVVAHESGHKFTLEHYLDVLLYTSSVPQPDPPSSLTFKQFAFDRPGNPVAAAATLGRYTTYLNESAHLVTRDKILDLYDVYGNILVPPPQVVVQGPTDSILRHNWLYPIIPETGRMWVYRQWTYIMDWAPRINQLPGSTPDLRSPDAWNFRPGDPSTFMLGDLDLACVQCH